MYNHMKIDYMLHATYLTHQFSVLASCTEFIISPQHRQPEVSLQEVATNFSKAPVS